MSTSLLDEKEREELDYRAKSCEKRHFIISKLETDTLVIICPPSYEGCKPTKRIKASLFLVNELFLSRAEWNYLTANSELSGDYSRVIKSRLQKKLEMFVNQELPILVEKGYLDVTEFRNVTENRNVLVAQPGRERRLSFGNTKNNENESPSRDLNPGPKVFATFPKKERGITKPSLCQAELLGQNKGNFSSTIFNASR